MFFNNRFTFEVTAREIVVSIIGALLLISMGFIIATTIHDKITERNEPYIKALKVDNNPDLFDHALKTEVGSVLSYGKVKTVKPLTVDNLDGEYLVVQTVKEEYTMHTRSVSYKCGNSTCHRDETYWTWDEYSRSKNIADTIKFLGRDLATEGLKYNDYMDSSKYFDDGYHKRVHYNTIDANFNASVYGIARTKVLNSIYIYPEETIAKVVEDKTTEADDKVVLFWVIWGIIIALGVGIFIALENPLLNSKGKGKRKGKR